ncbi:unnamed protein product [Chironomus riparius]|uniref:Uncharacterized protein n=1 Tax=Chironomus riparius TaxID=315576 RepID=A0A9N9RNL2_9DIPT|nr:unnamed protein product [Chironomus riparius]
MKDKCRKVPGGGEMIKINIDAKCSGGFLGLLAHSKKSRFYYVCKKDGVLTCMCKQTENFNRIKLKCEDKSHKKEGLTHEVVDHIVDKYKCSVMNGVYEENVLSTYGTTEYPQVTGQSIEDFDRDRISRLQNILRYLTFIRTINDRPQSFESFETTPALITSAPITPRTIIIGLQNPPTTESILRMTGPPEDPRNIEIDIENFRKNWNLDPTTPATTVLPKNAKMSPRILKTTTSKDVESTTTDSENSNAVKTRVSDETTTVMDTITSTETTTVPKSTISAVTSTILDTTTVLETTTLSLETTSVTETTLKGKDISSSTSSEKEQTTQESDALAEKDESSTVENVDETTGKLATRLVPRTTTEMGESEGKTAYVDDEEDSSLEEYFEYYYEHEPDKVLWKTNKTKVKVTGKNFDDEDDDGWRKFVTITESYNEITLPIDETTFASEETTVINEETTVSEDVVETTQSTTTEEPEDILMDTTTEIIEETTLANTEVPSTTTEILTTTIFESETTSEYPPEPLIKRFQGDLNFNDFEPEDSKSTSTTTEITSEFTETSTITLPSTTLTFDGITPPSTRLYKFMTTINPETTTNFDATTTEEADYQKTTELSSAITESATSKFDNLELKSFTTEIRTTAENSEIETTPAMEIISTTEALTLGQTDTTTVPTTDFSTLQTESLTILDSITTKIPRSMKTRANTEATTLNHLETTETTTISLPSTTLTNVKPKKVKKVKEEIGKKIEPTLKIPQNSFTAIKQEKPKSEEFEYYYTYEEYSVDDDGKEIKGIGSEIDEKKKKILTKTRRDNSNEYYAESISASHEDRISKVKKDYDYFSL